MMFLIQNLQLIILSWFIEEKILPTTSLVRQVSMPAVEFQRARRPTIGDLRYILRAGDHLARFPETGIGEGCTLEPLLFYPEIIWREFENLER